MKKEKSIGVNAVLNGLKTVLSVIFPLITYPYAARVLQVENIGKVDFANSIVSYFVLLAGLGIATYAIREGSRLRDNREDLEKFSNEIFSINTIASIFSVILLIVFVYSIPKLQTYSLIIAVQWLSILGNLIGVTWLYSLVEDYAYITVRSLIVHIVALLLMFLFVRDQSDFVFYAATTVVANVGANIFNFIHARKYVKVRFTTKLNLKKHYKPIMIIFASTVTTTIYVNSDKTILGFLSGDYYVGLYSTAVNVYTVLKSLIAAIILVSLPRLSNYIANGRREDYQKTANNIFNMFFIILLPVITGVFMISKEIIMVIAGATYIEAVTPLRILSFSLMFSMLAIYYSNAVLLPMKMEVIILKGTIISAVLNIVLNIVFISMFKQNGAAFTTLLAEIVMCIYQYKYVRKIVKINISIRYILSIFIGCISIIISCIIIDKLISLFIANLIIKIVFSVFIYGMVLFQFKNQTALDIFSGIIVKLDKRN